jgi:hypothetical protein
MRIEFTLGWVLVCGCTARNDCATKEEEGNGGGLQAMENGAGTGGEGAENFHAVKARD